MARAKGWRSRFLSIAIGCFSVVLLIVGVAGILLVWAGISYRQLGAPTAEDAALSIAVGDLAGPAAGGDSPAAAGDPAAAPPPGTTLATLSPSEFPGGARPRTPIRLNIMLSEGDFEILPGPPGRDISVEGTYATNYYELVQERHEDEGGEEISLRLKPMVAWFTRLMAGLNNSNNNPNKLTIRIPSDLPVDLHLRLDSGESKAELGGLTLTDLDVDLSKGDFRLSFDEPLAAPLPRMALSMQMGDGRVSGLGNARAGEMLVKTGMGDFRVALNGAWPAGSDSRVTINHSMGDLSVTIPEGVHIAEDSSSTVLFGGTSGRMGDDADEPASADAATLHLDVKTSMGGVSVRRSRQVSTGGG